MRRLPLVLAVIVGTIVAVATAKPALACSCAKARIAQPGMVSFEGQLAVRHGTTLTFKVTRELQGEVGSRPKVRTISGGEESCGRTWSAFRRYRVVAARSDGLLYSNACHPTETLGLAIPASPRALGGFELLVVPVVSLLLFYAVFRLVAVARSPRRTLPRDADPHA